MSASTRMSVAVSVDAATRADVLVFPPSEQRRYASALLSIGEVGHTVSVHIETRDQLLKLAGLLTDAHREWAALTPEHDDLPADEMEAAEYSADC